ncbi:hypothetical protein EJ03DRAFT_325243 [Teratosphaeria nubilosa]|uniref:Uncharacterized protein n=1 Tax=Teratosphaeria nubilosa TaxID=161662 RepID=A0A6G1LF67_9PEZI|nr:hypothetical protein EJ03DRAFT_325243 [Teratosphaeria nubilosa]
MRSLPAWSVEIQSLFHVSAMHCMDAEPTASYGCDHFQTPVSYLYCLLASPLHSFFYSQSQTSQPRRTDYTRPTTYRPLHTVSKFIMHLQTLTTTILALLLSAASTALADCRPCNDNTPEGTACSFGKEGSCVSGNCEKDFTGTMNCTP